MQPTATIQGPVVRNGRRAPPSAANQEEARLLRFELGALWRALKKEPVAVWALCFYMGVEYLRPQMAYPALDVLPWGKASIAICALALMFGGSGVKTPPKKWYLLDTMIIVFHFWVLMSMFNAWSPEEAFKNWSVPGAWIVLYFLIKAILITPRRMMLFWASFFLLNFKMSQFGTRLWIQRGFSFSSWGATGAPGWFQNSGEFAMEMVAMFAMGWFFFAGLKDFMGLRRYRIYLAIIPFTAFASVLASSSRGGQLALGVVIVTLLIATKVRPRTFIISGAILAIGWFALPAEQKERFSTMGQDDTSQARLYHWAIARETAAEYPVLGIGFGNWLKYYDAQHLASDNRVEQVHNTTLQAAVEIGYPGLAMFIVMVALSFLMNRRTRKRCNRAGTWGPVLHGMALGLDLAMVGLLVAGQFMSVLFYPMFWVGFGLTTSLAEITRHAESAQRRRARRPVVRAPAPAMGTAPVLFPTPTR